MLGRNGIRFDAGMELSLQVFSMRWLILLTALFVFAASASEGKIKAARCSAFFKNKHKVPLSKPIIIMVIKNDCPYCKEEIENLRKDDRFKELAAKKYLLVVCEKDDPLLPPPFSTTDIVPSFFVVNKNLKFIAYPATGAVPPSELDKWLEDVYNAYVDYMSKNRSVPAR